MRISIILGIILLITGSFMFFVTKTNLNEEEYGYLFLKPSEKNIGLEIFNKSNLLVIIPENLEIYGKTKNLEQYGDDLREFYGGFE